MVRYFLVMLESAADMVYGSRQLTNYKQHDDGDHGSRTATLAL